MAEEPRKLLAEFPALRDWTRIFGAARMALHPPKLALALAALLLSFLWGVMLDGVWRIADATVEETAIARFVDPQSAAAADLLEAAIRRTAPGGLAAETSPAVADSGVFQLWRDHTLAHVQGALQAATTLHFSGPNSVWSSVGMICRGTRWMVSEHYVFALLFLLGGLAIWSLFGAAICRIAAVQFARDEKIGIGEALRFVKPRYGSGFFSAPLLPLCIVLLVSLVMGIGGFFLWIPGIGNAFSVLFVLALLGGLGLAMVSIGCVGGGSFFWPTVAVEGSDGFDAVSRAFSYFFGRPFRTIVFGLTALVWGGICWTVGRWILLLALQFTHSCVSWGVGGFGTGWWGMRGEAGAEITKLDAIWALPTFSDLYQMGPRAQMHGWEIFAAVLVGITVFLVIGMLWAFLASYYFSASTIIYFALRRAVDATDFEDVYIDEPDEVEEGESPPMVSAPPAESEEPAPPAESPPEETNPPSTESTGGAPSDSNSEDDPGGHA